MKKNILLTAIGVISSIGIAICQPSPGSCFNVNGLSDGASNDVAAFRKIEDAAIIIYSQDSNYRFESNMSNFDDEEYDQNTAEFTLALPPTRNRQTITVTKIDCPTFKQEITIDSITPKEVRYYNIKIPEVKPMFQQGTVSISTFPSGAVIEIEGMGDYQKRSPITSLPVKSDYWPVIILKNGYKKMDTVIYVKPNGLTEFTFILTQSNDPMYAHQEPNIDMQEPNNTASAPTQNGAQQPVQQQGNYQTNNNQYSSAGNNQYSGSGSYQASGSDYAEQTPQPNYQPFYDKLNSDGNWVQDPNYGYVWYPSANAETGFAPYSSNGYWTYTSYGWTWVSNYSWGAIPFHYGRWGCDPVNGWYWVPGNQWGPAWVNWCSTNDGYYGWAPLRPGIENTSCNVYWIPSERYVFVQQQYISSENVSAYYVPRENNSYYIRNSYVINERSFDNNQNPVYVHGPKRQDVESSSGRPVFMRSTQTQTANYSQSHYSNFVSVERPRINQVNKNTVAPVPPYVMERSGLAPVSSPNYRQNNNAPIQSQSPSVQQRQYQQPPTNNNQRSVQQNFIQQQPRQSQPIQTQRQQQLQNQRQVQQTQKQYQQQSKRQQQPARQQQRQQTQRQQQPARNTSGQKQYKNSNNNSQQHH